MAADAILANQMALGIGPQAAVRFAAALFQAQTVFWNDPIGTFERERYARHRAVARSSVPRARSRWVVTAAMMNMMMNGNTPMNSGANRFSASELFSTYLSRTISTEGTAISIATVRGSCRSWVRTRRAVAQVSRHLMGAPSGR